MQTQQLRSAAGARASRVAMVAGPSRLPVRVRAEPPKVESTREFREDTNEVSVPTKNADGSVYVDVNAPPSQSAKPRDNMSKEMKARLRQEYVGFGGAENKSMGSNYFLTICVVISVLAVMSKLIGAI